MPMMRSVVVLLLVSYVLVVQSFTGISSNSVIARSKQVSATSLALSSPHNHHERSLYDIMGASPTSSQRQLKLRYAELAKRLHPDAGGGSPQDTAKFSEIAAAWSVLGDPKERLRYDRELRAKEFTTRMETLLDAGIKNAVPFLQKTADTTIAAVDASSKTMQDVGERVGRARDRYELDQKCRELEQLASKEKARASSMRTQLKNINNKKNKELSRPNAKLSATEARRLLESFVAMDNKLSSSSSIPAARHSISSDIKSLETIEAEFQQKNRQFKESESAVRLAKKNAENANKAEWLATRRLEEAQKELARAQQAIKDCAAAAKTAASRQSQAMAEADKASSKLKTQQDKVRTSLLKKEGESLQGEATWLKQECGKVENEAKRLQQEAQEVRTQSEQMHAAHRRNNKQQQ